MRKFLLLLILLAGACLPALARGKPKEKIVVLANVNIVDVESGSTLPDLAVVIKKGRISAIARHALIAPSRDMVVVNASGKYLVPGLWDMRVRLLEGTDTERVKSQIFPLLIANGVTGVRDLGSDPEALRRLRVEVERGGVVGPRIVFSAPGREGPVVAVDNLEEARAALAALKDKRADLLVGTDSPPGADPGLALHRQLQLLVEAGLTPPEVLRAVTLNPARFLGKEKEMGEVEVGRLADLVLLDADPTEDIGNLDKIAGVVVAGRYFSRRELDQMLAQAEAAAQKGTK